LLSIKQRETKEHVHEDMKNMVHEEALHELGCETKTNDQLSNFLHCCLILLNDPYVMINLMQMLANFMGEKGMERTISSPLPERYLC
jgi:23S rRNA A2030 N6-methylase RlmJ